MEPIRLSQRALLAIAAGTRRLQSRFPHRPIKGLTRFSNLIGRLFPPYQGMIAFPDGTRMVLDSRQPAERWLLFSGNYQPALTHLLRRHTPVGGYCMDIGANLGFYAVKMAHWVGSAGRVAAFEPNPAMLERIEANLAANGFGQVAVVKAAVHDHAGQVEFYVSDNAGKSSVNPIPNALTKISVPTLTVDEYVAGQGWPRLDAIKMDIEGNDCNALTGARESLTRFRPFLVFEYKGTTPREVAESAFALLARLDYGVWSLEGNGALHRFDWATAAVKQADIVCIPAGKNPIPAP